MNPEIKAKWVEALRSGKYQQTTVGKLRDGDAFCCLGVLCDLYLPEWIDGAWKDGEDRYLPPEVMEWAGLDDEDPSVPGDDEDEDGPSEYELAVLNDDGHSFAAIADLIERHL